MHTAPGFDVDFRVKSLETLIQELPADLRSEVRNFVEFLLLKRAHVTEKPLPHEWAGTQRKDASPLRGTVLRYEDPFAPVAESEWEALQ